MRDPGLSAAGIKQAAKLEIRTELAILSCFRRAQQTFQFSKISAKRTVTSELFREWTAYGPSCFLENEKDIKQETHDQLQKRAKEAWTFIEKQKEKHITVVAHGGFNSVMLQLKGVSKLFKNTEMFCFQLF